MMLIAVIHGPNLNLLGVREPDVYGTVTLARINEQIEALAEELSVEVSICQHNSEGAMIDAIHRSGGYARIHAHGRIGQVLEPLGVALHVAQLRALDVPSEARLGYAGETDHGSHASRATGQEDRSAPAHAGQT